MSLFGKKQKHGGFMDMIRCDEPSYLIWKWRPAGSQLGGDRENAIRWGSSLRVKDGEVAVFVYKQNNGTIQDFILGPYDDIIKTANFPVLASIVGLAYEGGTPFQAEVYFINLAKIVQIRFGVPYFDVYDPRYGDFGVPVAVRGTVTFCIEDYREFIKLHRLNSFDLETFQSQIQHSISRYVKDTVTNILASGNTPLIQIETKISQINDAIERDIRSRLKEDFGVVVSAVDISAVELDKSSEGYRQLMSITRDITARKIEAETADYTERLRIQREEGQYALHKQTQTANMEAYKVEKQAEVGIAGAQALGEMGKNGGGNVDLSGQGSGFDPAAMMAGMALGGAVGQNIAGTMNNIMSNTSTTPPPVPKTEYYVAVNGNATGPFDISVLSQMAKNGQFNKNTLVWTAGMEQWTKAENLPDLSGLLNNIIPPIPPEDTT